MHNDGTDTPPSTATRATPNFRGLTTTKSAISSSSPNHDYTTCEACLTFWSRETLVPIEAVVATSEDTVAGAK